MYSLLSYERSCIENVNRLPGYTYYWVPITVTDLKFKEQGIYMNIRKILSAIFSVICVATLMFVAANSANAQGRYSARYSRSDVSNIVSRLEQSSDAFRRNFDRSMDNSNINGTQAEDRFNNIVRDFENSVDRLRREFDRNDSWWESRNNVEGMVRDSRPVNTMMTTLPFRRNIENQWNQLRNNINTLADTYDLPGLNGGGWNGGSGGGGGNAPNWAVGTFYGRNPQTGGTITLTISRNGSVTADFDGSQSYGTLNRNTLNMSGEIARVTQINNGLRTRGNDGQVIDYYRNNSGGGSGGGGGNVPSWAIGTFYGRNPQTGGTITLMIDGSGRVTADFQGSQSYGTLNGSNLNMSGDTARVTRLNNGLRTRGTDGATIDYFRNSSGGNDGGNDGGGNAPSWAVGTFYGRNPQTGGRITLTINRNGNVTVDFGGGNQSYGTIDENYLRVGNATSRVTRIRNGIRTTSTTDSQVIEYSTRPN